MRRICLLVVCLTVVQGFIGTYTRPTTSTAAGTTTIRGDVSCASTKEWEVVTHTIGGVMKAGFRKLLVSAMLLLALPTTGKAVAALPLNNGMLR